MISEIINNSLSSNTYILFDEKTAIIDPGISEKKLLGKINETAVSYIILTHCHYDHIACAKKLKEITNAKVLAHYFSEEIFRSSLRKKIILSELFSAEDIKLEIDIKLKEGDEINLGYMKLKILHTPGHTKDSICLYEEKTKSLFSGDTVFKDSIGRADFPTGNFKELKISIEKLINLDENCGIEKIYPGHGETFTSRDIKEIYKYFFKDG
ncbi:MAG: MBL fold metallo-hydrolase [Candidatus Altiarchaeota archaeon]